MSSESLPITPAAFSLAIQELPLSAVYAKASELRNSIAHLQRSNAELRGFVTESCETETEKQELEGYITENEEVVVSMNERMGLLKAEVERRGQGWVELDDLNRDEESKEGEEGGGPGHGPESSRGPVVNGAGAHRGPERDDDEGVYL